tara:strand:+ start:1843 stop:2178 length:336 start_codon:yes stop_codon:yes gene_type:complete
MNFYMELEVQSVDVTPEKFDEVFDEIADALHECTGIENADLAGNSATLILTFSMDVSGRDEIAAFTTGLSAVRTALHSAGGSTPGWEDHFSIFRHLIEKASQAQKGNLVDA